MKLVSKVKAGTVNLACECATEYFCNRKKYRCAFAVMLAVVMLLSMGMLAFAGTQQTIGGLGAQVTNILTEVYNALSGIITVAVGVFCAAALIMRMTANQQTAAAATKWLIRVLVCYAIFMCLGMIMGIIRNAVGAGSAFTPGTSE